MKKILIVAFAAGLLISACKSQKSTTKASPNEPGPTQLAAVQTRIPEASMDDLKKGHGIYYSTCTKCHAPKNVAGIPEDRLQKTIENMAGKAKLTDLEKDAVWKYALSMNLSSK